jgi:O-antigen biosynthesis protein
MPKKKRTITNNYASLLTLLPAADVVALETGYRADSVEPWLRASSIDAFPSGRVVEIRYSVGLTDEVVRPIIRFIDKSGERHDSLMPAASEGAGFWRGLIPGDTAEIRISPTNRLGEFSFQLDHVRLLPLTIGAGRRLMSPKRSFFAASARMVGLKAEADLNLRWVFCRAETQNFTAWKARRSSTIAAKPQDQSQAFVIVANGGASPNALARTYASLCAQTHQNWRLAIVGPSSAESVWLAAQHDPRTNGCASFSEIELPANGWVGFFEAGDSLAPQALACFAAHLARYRAHKIVYADEIRIGRDSGAAPIFKPDWSPIRQRFAPYVGRAAFLSGDLVKQAGLPDLMIPERGVDDALRASSASSVGHLRRAVIESIGPAPAVFARQAPRSAARLRPKIGIVIPTRDRVDLLEPCLKSVLEKSTYTNFDVMVVDNGSVQPRTIEMLAKAQARDRRLLVVRSPGPFNFSALSNLGAAKLNSEFLLFLNNDTEALQADWLENLVELAAEADVGAVGARLLYPNGRLQHAGVVVGFGGVAGHFAEGQRGGAAGWLGKNLVPHEVSAVTGACLMIERRKFEAVDGFDALNLPIDLNDIDLCLRLAERGWRSICDGRTRLLHHASASRGKGTVRPQKVYKKERDYFSEKWRHVIRDDPFFNPNLSLYDHVPKLG